jgi:predicted PurR-regulated permease PerM
VSSESLETTETPPARLRDVPVDVRAVALTGLFVLAVFYTAFHTRAFIVPVILAVLLHFLFSPLVRRLKRARIPQPLSAATVVLGLIAALGFGIYGLSGPAADWIERAPQSLRTIQARLDALQRPMASVTRTAEQVEKLTEVTESPPERGVVTVQVRDRSLRRMLFGGTQDLLGSALTVFVLLYFLLASGDLFLTKLIRVLPTLQDKKRAVQIARDTEDQISSYLITTTAINLVFGIAVGVAMHLLGVPNPALWGVLAAVTNYVPYLGALAMVVILGLVALLQFGDLGRTLLVPGVFVALNLAESMLLTPVLLGRRLTLNPVVVFVGVLFWGWLWGIVGALLAVPILAAFKIVCDHVERLAPVAEFLGP